MKLSRPLRQDLLGVKMTGKRHLLDEYVCTNCKNLFNTNWCFGWRKQLIYKDVTEVQHNGNSGTAMAVSLLHVLHAGQLLLSSIIFSMKYFNLFFSKIVFLLGYIMVQLNLWLRANKMWFSVTLNYQIKKA